MFNIIVMVIWYFDGEQCGFCVRYVDFRMSLNCYWNVNVLVFWGYTLWSLDIHSIWMVVQMWIAEGIKFFFSFFLETCFFIVSYSLEERK
jgi:hypothetical protein